MGMLLAVPAMLLWMASHPILTENRFFGKIIGLLGGVSTAVYVTHLVVYDIYCTYLGWRLENLSVRKQEFIATVFVVSVTLIGCFVWQILWNWVKKLRKS